MKKLLVLLAKFWYARAERRLAKQIEEMTHGHIAGESAKALARNWLTRRLQKQRRDVDGYNHIDR